MSQARGRVYYILVVRSAHAIVRIPYIFCLTPPVGMLSPSWHLYTTDWVNTFCVLTIGALLRSRFVVPELSLQLTKEGILLARMLLSLKKSEVAIVLNIIQLIGWRFPVSLKQLRPLRHLLQLVEGIFTGLSSISQAIGWRSAVPKPLAVQKLTSLSPSTIRRQAILYNNNGLMMFLIRKSVGRILGTQVQRTFRKMLCTATFSVCLKPFIIHRVVHEYTPSKFFERLISLLRIIILLTVPLTCVRVCVGYPRVARFALQC